MTKTHLANSLSWISFLDWFISTPIFSVRIIEMTVIFVNENFGSSPNDNIFPQLVD